MNLLIDLIWTTVSHLSEPNVSSDVVVKTVGDTSTTLPRFTSALIYSWSTISNTARTLGNEALGRERATYVLC